MGLKSAELQKPTSCFNKAEWNEPIFVLLGRDPAAAATIRFWCEERQRLGIDWPDSEKQIEAQLAATQLQLFAEKRHA